ncbi:hypothetical protein CSKR_202139 [Clonorchis sinensis]|uniref:Uncharacterized protein n=1 Tax=Clonorchis sinensis TaxID=79923 RepID=A0A8T1LW55_CLOSI|nr:hypothetical protein CSKR_202139 [Clonorchis sinensis]
MPLTTTPPMVLLAESTLLYVLFSSVISNLSVLKAYASGCDVVILNECFIRVQIIPWDKLDGLIVQAVSCSHYDGKIAVANSKRIYIYCPKLSTGSTVRCSLSNVTWYLQHCIDLPAQTLVYCLGPTSHAFLPQIRAPGRPKRWSVNHVASPSSLDQLRRTHPPKFLLGSSPLGSETTSVGELSMDETSGDIPIPPKTLRVGNPYQLAIFQVPRYRWNLVQTVVILQPYSKAPVTR